MLSMATEQLDLRLFIISIVPIGPLSRMGHRSILWYESETLGRQIQISYWTVRIFIRCVYDNARFHELSFF
jgi:hypothetical protein